MTRQIDWTDRALKDAERLAPRDRERVVTAIERLAAESQGDVRKLQGHGDEWRLRVGEIRVRFTFDDPANVIRILRVLPRGRAYRD